MTNTDKSNPLVAENIDQLNSHIIDCFHWSKISAHEAYLAIERIEARLRLCDGERSRTLASILSDEMATKKYSYNSNRADLVRLAAWASLISFGMLK
jgi:hypothetical protein